MHHIYDHKVLKIISMLIVALFLLTVFVPLESVAHAPSSVTLSYNYGNQNLSVTISHSVSNPSSHYVQTVTIYKNSIQVASQSYTSQPSTNPFTYHYSVSASDGDTLSAKADCNLGGSASGSVQASAPDETDPTIQITSPSNGSEVTKDKITISGTASDNKGLNKVEVAVNDGAWATATGKASWTKEVTLEEGSNTIMAMATDSSDNTATFSISVVYNATPPPDETPPSIDILSPVTGSTFDVENITVSGSSSDDEGISQIDVRVNSGEWMNAMGTVSWTINVTLVEGNNTLEARATDTSDNTKNTSILVKYNPAAQPDTTAPILTIQNPDNGTVVANDEVTVSGTAYDDRGVSLIQGRVNNGTWNVATGTTVWSIKLPLMEGNNTIDIWAGDDAGNNVTETIIIVYDPEEPPDTEHPVVNITSPLMDEEFTEPDITVTGTASDNSCLCRVELSLNEGNWQLANGRKTWSIDLQIISGTNTISARVTDDSGNMGYHNISVIYNDTPPADTTLPEVGILGLTDNNTVYDADLVVNGTASDDRGLERVEVNLNDGSWLNATGTDNWTIELELEEGVNTLKVKAIDLSGNENMTSITINYEIPYTPGTLDGVITENEYRAMESFDDGNFMLYWDYDGDVWKVGLMVNATGWISLGLDPTARMKDSDMIIAWVDSQGHVFVIDAFSTDEVGPHPSDITLGGTDDIIEFGGTETDGWTTIEFTRTTNSTDQYDRNVFEGQLMDIIWGYSATDDFTAYHDMNRGTVEAFNFSLIDEVPVVDGDDDDDDVQPVDDDDGEAEGQTILGTVIIMAIGFIVLIIIIVIVIVLVFRGKKSQDEE